MSDDDKAALMDELLWDTDPMTDRADLTDAQILFMAVEARDWAQRDLDDLIGPPWSAGLASAVREGHSLSCACRMYMRDRDCACGQFERDCEAM